MGGAHGFDRRTDHRETGKVIFLQSLGISVAVDAVDERIQRVVEFGESHLHLVQPDSLRITHSEIADPGKQVDHLRRF